VEAFGSYLLKSILWLTGFTVVYFLFLRNDRFFTIKRYFLLAGIVISFVFPLITFHYQVEVSAPVISQADITQAGIPVNTGIKQDTPYKIFDYRIILLSLYLAGALILLFRIILHMRTICKTIIKMPVSDQSGVKVIRAPRFSTPFSFFNYVFINPSVSETETGEIMNHELVHVRQKHWLDLLLVEIVRIFQWINPFAWLLARFIRLNHEYLADELALLGTANPAIYRATLVNQVFSSPVISLSNSFNYSNSKKRFEMMKTIISSPYRKLKVLAILPVFAIIFYAFATPEYNYIAQISKIQPDSTTSKINIKEVKGIILDENNKPVEGVKIVVTGTNTRATTDDTGNFTISDASKEASLVISLAGYKTQFIKAELSRKMEIILVKDPDYNKQVEIRTVGAGGTFFTPVFVIDGVITDKRPNDIPPSDIAIVNVLKDRSATDKYGDKGKNGVIEITTKNKAAESGIKVPFRRRAQEDFPTFQGERYFTFRNWVYKRVQYPSEAQTNRIEGNVQVTFTVEADGTVSNVKATGYEDLLLADAVVQVVKSSPKWEPAKNTEAQIPFESSVDIRFRLPDQVIINEAPFVVVEEMPMYPGGDGALLDFIKASIQYPDSAKAKKIEGRVIVRFCVNTEGKAERISILKGVHSLLDAEAVRIVSLVAGFKPGMQGGQAVNVWYMVPVTFSLRPETTQAARSQENAEELSAETEVDKMPEYPGGVSALLKFIAENTLYPEEAKIAKIQGKVIVRYVITKDGYVTNISVLKGVHPLLDAEAVRVVSLFPKWEPGFKGGKPVDVWYTVPLTFTVK